MASYRDALEFNRKWKVQLMKEFRAALAGEYGETVGTIRENHIWESASSERNYYEIECKYLELSEVPK